jgi:hypothetical protein
MTNLKPEIPACLGAVGELLKISYVEVQERVGCLGGQPHVDYKRIYPGPIDSDRVYRHAGEEF